MLGTGLGKSLFLIPGRNSPFLTLSATYSFHLKTMTKETLRFLSLWDQTKRDISSWFWNIQGHITQLLSLKALKCTLFGKKNVYGPLCIESENSH